MNTKSLISCFLSGAFVLATSGLAAEDQLPPLSVNPFERPAWLDDSPAAPVGNNPTSQRGTLDLRATLMAGKQSLVNVGGRIVAIGEEVNGYVLMSVTEGEAVFSSNGNVIRVSVVSQQEGQDE